jgi:hypothetical protein
MKLLLLWVPANREKGNKLSSSNFIHDLLPQEFYDSYNNFIFANDSKVFDKLISKYHFLSIAKEVPGEIVELGIFKGSGLAGWLKTARALKSNRNVIGFDLFDNEVLVSNIKTDDVGVMKSLFADRNFSPIGYKEILDHMLHEMEFKNFELIQGDVFETIPKYLEENPGFRISIANFDLDTRDPTYFCLDQLWSRIVKGGVLIFDEYGINEWTESEAVDQFIYEKSLRLIRSNFYAPSAYVIKD